MGKVELVEVGPRDGLQNEAVTLTTAEKIEFVERVVAAGARRVEVSSFVNPRLVPQLADAAEVFAALADSGADELSALVLNVRGVERSIEAGVSAVNMVILATDTFSLRNQGVDVATMIDRYAEMHALARSAGQSITLTVGAAFGCPFEGAVAPSRIAEIIEMVNDFTPDELCLADTVGLGVPSQVTELVGVAGELLPGTPLRAHFHNTRNTGYANAITAVAAGVGALDASLGGIGGCPFAPAATGNIATEDLAYLLERNGVDLEVDVEAYIVASRWLGAVMNRDMPGLLAKAGAALL